jgi:pimeloyl-ACP methyl ester carboxylesterase
MYGLFGWWVNAEKGAVLVASNQEPYDWWTGYHEQYYAPRQAGDSAWKTGVVRPYTQKRLLSFVDWLGSRLSLDRSRFFVSGSSMGGSGSIMMAIRHPDRIAWGLGWVGVHIPRESPQFKGSYELVWGRPELNVKFEDGTPVWDYYDDAEYVRRHPAAPIGLLTFSNGKNDGGIGWSQAVRFVKALQEARQPHLFVWGQNGHGERARMPDNGGERVNPLDLRVDQSLPAFTRSSLDDDPGDGNPSTGAPAGQINASLAWTPDSIRDEKDEWVITLRLAEGSKGPGATADVTPRRLQRFKLQPGDRVQWANSINGREAQTGEAVADQWGLVTLPQVQIARSGSRLSVRLSSRTP